MARSASAGWGCSPPARPVQALRDVSPISSADRRAAGAHLAPLSPYRHRKRARARGGAALNAGDVVECGRLMNKSHVWMRDDYEISCPELDTLVGLRAIKACTARA